MHSGKNDVCDVNVTLSYTGQAEKYAWKRQESNLRALERQPNVLPTAHGQAWAELACGYAWLPFIILY